LKYGTEPGAMRKKETFEISAGLAAKLLTAYDAAIGR